MRIKLDQNLSQYLRDDLTALKHDVDTVLDEGLSGSDDPEVLKVATSKDRILLTLDKDFPDLKSIPTREPSRSYCFSSASSRRIGRSRICVGFSDLRKYYGQTTVVERRRARILKMKGD